MLQYLEHGTFGFCIFDILAAVFAAGVIVAGVMRYRALRDRKRELEDALSSKMADKVI